MNFSDNASDFVHIINYLEKELDLIIDSFDGFQNVIGENWWLINNIDIHLLRVRVALMFFNKNAENFLESIKTNTNLKEIINNIAPGYHPLMEAVNRMNYEHAMFLLEKGANPNQGTEPWFPLLQADSNRDIKMVRILESFGADWDHNIKVYEYWENDVQGRTGKKYNRFTEA